MSFAAGSFRDPAARVLADDGPQIRRVLSAAAAADDTRLRAAGLFDELERAGWLIASRRRDDVPAPDGWSAVVESPRLPFVSYPAEWSFGMLRDAALLTLQITERALERGAILKDASAFNVLFEGAQPRFVDVSSLMSRDGDGPWHAYGQFCDHFLAPLMLEAYRGVPFQSWLRGSLEGLDIGTLARLLSARDLVRPGVATHVMARTALERRSGTLAPAARHAARGLALPAAALLRNVRSLQRLVAGLRSRAVSPWADYRDAEDHALSARKAAFVAAAGARLGGGQLAWDVGANSGRYSRLLAEHYAYIVALDADAGAIDRLYAELRGSDEARRVLPMVVDVMQPSPPRGWRGRERASLVERGRPQLALYLALIHHLCLGRGVPLAEFLDFARDTAPAAVIEFVAAEDPHSQALLASRTAQHPGYDLANFRRLAAARFQILDEAALTPTRQLFLLA
ncbi:MAG: methyltransferase [bacterium]